MFQADRDYSPETARLIDEEIRRLVDEAYTDADRLLTENWETVTAVAEALLKYETLLSDEVHRIIRGEPLNKPTVADLLTAGPARPPRPPKPAPGASPTCRRGAAQPGVSTLCPQGSQTGYPGSPSRVEFRSLLRIQHLTLRWITESIQFRKPGTSHWPRGLGPPSFCHDPARPRPAQ